MTFFSKWRKRLTGKSPSTQSGAASLAGEKGGDIFRVLQSGLSSLQLTLTKSDVQVRSSGESYSVTLRLPPLQTSQKSEVLAFCERELKDKVGLKSVKVSMLPRASSASGQGTSKTASSGHAAGASPATRGQTQPSRSQPSAAQAQVQASGAQQVQRAASLAQVKQIVAIASGKGGVGKSTTTVQLAHSLHAKGYKVGILDADIYGPSIPTMLPASTPSSSDGKSLKPSLSFGIKTMSLGLFNDPDQAAILRGPMAANLISQFLQQVDWGELDYLLIDYPPGTGDIQLTLSQSAPLTGAIMVTTPQKVALADVKKAIMLFETTKVPVLGVLETMSFFICDGCTKRHQIFPGGGTEQLARHYQIELLGKIPLEPALAASLDEGKRLSDDAPDSVSAQAYAGAATALNNLLQERRSKQAAAAEQVGGKVESSEQQPLSMQWGADQS